jgi:hypothetical protein
MDQRRKRRTGSQEVSRGWPSDVFGVRVGGVRVASAESLLSYRAAFDFLQPTVEGKRVTAQEWLEQHEGRRISNP